MMLVRMAAVIAGWMFLSLAAWAEPAAPPGDEIKAIKLDYAERSSGDGRMAAAEITVSGAPARYYVRGTDVSAPFSVQVIAASTARPLDVSLHRQNWGKAVHTGSTGNTGAFVFEGRAHGDVGVQLTSPDGQPARATIVFWQGTPAPPGMARVYTNPSFEGASAGGRSAAGSDGGSLVLYVIAGLLAVIVIFLGLLVLRRGKGGGSAAAALLLVGGLALTAPDAGPAWAQGEGPRNPFTGEPLPGPSGPKPDETKPDPFDVPNPFDVDDPLQIPSDKDKDATAGRPDDKPKDDMPDNPFAGEGTTGTAKDVGPKPDDPNPFAGEGTTHTGRPIEPKPGDFETGSSAPKDDPAPADADYASRLAEAERRISDLNRQASANRAEIERLRMLIESDRQNEPDPSNLPPMPLTCRPPAVERSDDAALESAWRNYDDCQTCYREPLRQLDELLLNYERLRIIYMSTAEFVSTAITIGDSVQKPHQLVEAAWAQEKAGIQATFNGTKRAYDEKWAEFNDKLSGLLDEIGACEADLNNNPMWREKEGRMFFQTIKASYQRTN